MTTEDVRGGSLPWMAPELLNNECTSIATDVWAFGMVVLELFTRLQPFHDCRTPANLMYRLSWGPLPHRPPAHLTEFRMTDIWWGICTSCWRTDPSLRPTIEVIVEKVRRAVNKSGPVMSGPSVNAYPLSVGTSHLSSAGDGPRTAPISGNDCLLPCTTLRGHANKILSMAFPPDGRRIISGSANRLVCQWDVHSRTQVGSLFTGHLDWVRSVAFSPNGGLVASGSYDSTIRLWNPRTGVQCGPPLQGHAGTVFSVVSSPNGRGVFSGSADQTICLWDVPTGAKVRALIGHTDKIQSVAVSRDCTIASGSYDKTLRLWDARAGV
ncbi:WD40-repeat-containing domain protein [Pisolithus tinctorius]|nr:WD40-repeat-containing domain protein [Pisolithus tinctorius]